MKAIAEYFRDLAAGDRFFGAEPPQPDADMLHRIAEETNRSRVDAELTDNSLVLRQTDSRPETEMAAPVAAAVAAPVVAPVVAEAAPVVEEKAEEAEPEVEEVEAAAEEVPAEDAGVAAPDDAETISEHAGYGQRDSIAEKLQRIRAVVSKENAASDEEAAFFNEDEHAEEFDASAAPSYEAEYGAAYEEDSDQGDEPDGGSMLASVMARAADDASDEDASEQEDDSTLNDALAALNEDAAEEAVEETDEFEPEIDIETEPASEAQAFAEAQIEEDSTLSTDTEMDMPDVAADEDALDASLSERRPIKVAKISREEIEAAQSGDISVDTIEPSGSSELSPIAEAELMLELAQVEAEMQAAADQDTMADDMDAEEDVTSEADAEHEAEERAARKERALKVEDEDDALNRLMDATSSRMSDDGEGAVRRASIAHLKAAVAATKADDSIAQAAADEDEREMDQYRDDLARVVRPGRAQSNPEDSETQRPSPLVLVSEQRIDGEEAPAPDAAEVSPRRINAGNLALEEEFEEEVDPNPFAASDQESFRAFAARHAAVELPDLLEAAAAHYAYVEQKDDFTRPMLMNKTTSINEEGAISREEGLRAFGSLLRRGRIVKRGNGKFVISETSQFAPEAREAGE